MTFSIRSILICISLIATGWTTPAVAQTVGEVVNVTPGASFIRRGGRVAVEARAAVEQGDTIVTNRSGLVEIVFSDDTKLAVGPRSRLVISDVTMGASSRAERFALRAVSGTYRFLSGRSRKEVYSIRTPSANLGIRGTEFDMTIVTTTLTDVVGFGGRILMCNEAGSCAIISGQCPVGQAPSFSQVRAPADRSERDAILRSDMPFVIDQSPLSPPFHLNVASCGEIDEIPAGYRPFREDPNAGPQPLGEDRKPQQAPPVEEEEEDDDGEGEETTF